MTKDEALIKLLNDFRPKPIIDNHFAILGASCELIESIEKSQFDEKEKNEARKQYLIRLINAFEVSMKDFFIDIICFHYFNYPTDLIKKKYTLTEMIDLLKRNSFESKKSGVVSKEKTTIGMIIADNFNFQNLSEIDKAFRPIYGESIFNLRGCDGMYQVFDKYINLRHEIIHERNFGINLIYEELREFNRNLMSFMLILSNELQFSVYGTRDMKNPDGTFDIERIMRVLYDEHDLSKIKKKES